MSQALFPPTIDYQVLVPKTALTAGQTTQFAALAASAAKIVQLIGQFKCGNQTSGAFVPSIKPVAAGSATLDLAGVGVANAGAPAAFQQMSSAQQTFYNSNAALGTDAPADGWSSFDFTFYNWNLTTNRFGKGFILNSNSPVARALAEPLFWTDIAGAQYDGFTITLGGAQFAAGSWYEIIKLG